MLFHLRDFVTHFLLLTLRFDTQGYLGRFWHFGATAVHTRVSNKHLSNRVDVTTYVPRELQHQYLHYTPGSR